MRVVGYLREGYGPDEADPAFVQGEALRRWVRNTGHNLVSVCQDLRHEGHPLERDGYQALLGVVSSRRADGVVMPSLETLSTDLMIQEIMIWDLLRRGVTVLSIDEADHQLLLQPSRERMLMRDLLARLEDYYEWAYPAGDEQLEEEAVDDDDEVIVQLIPASEQ